MWLQAVGKFLFPAACTLGATPIHRPHLIVLKEVSLHNHFPSCSKKASLNFLLPSFPCSTFSVIYPPGLAPPRCGPTSSQTQCSASARPASWHSWKARRCPSSAQHSSRPWGLQQGEGGLLEGPAPTNC